MWNLFRFGLALTATVGMISVARPALAVEASARQSGDSGQTIAAFAILGTGAAAIAYSAKQGHPRSIHRSVSGQQSQRSNPQLQKKLLRLLHNDRQAADRLLAYVQQTHPDRSPNWVMEKVIYDLERDRNRH